MCVCVDVLLFPCCLLALVGHGGAAGHGPTARGRRPRHGGARGARLLAVLAAAADLPRRHRRGGRPGRRGDARALSRAELRPHTGAHMLICRHAAMALLCRRAARASPPHPPTRAHSSPGHATHADGTGASTTAPLSAQPRTAAGGESGPWPRLLRSQDPFEARPPRGRDRAIGRPLAPCTTGLTCRRR